MEQNKKLLRKMKRFLKKEGNKKKRHWFKSQIEESLRTDSPLELDDNYDFGNLSSKWLNGIDNDKTRKTDKETKQQQDPFMDNPYWTSE